MRGLEKRKRKRKMAIDGNTLVSLLFIGGGLLFIGYYMNRQPGLRGNFLTQPQAVVYSTNSSKGPKNYLKRSSWNRV